MNACYPRNIIELKSKLNYLIEEKRSTMTTKLDFLSKRGRPFVKVLRWLSPLALVLVLGGLFAMNTSHTVLQVHAAGSSTRIWLQVMDSCKQALPSANFTLVTPNGK